MIRAAVWTVGLFAVGGVVCSLFPGPFVEPIVLLVLGTTLFLVSGRAVASARAQEPEHGSDDVSTPTRAAR